MKLKKTLAVLLALVLTLGTTAAFASDTFTDVPADAYYADAVTWAAEQGITQGRGNGIFDPYATVTRAEAVTFLWRMAGMPEPTQTRTFADVEADANNGWYKTAVQWAVENEITNGTGTGFSPTVTCSRGMILTMLYRMEGNPWDEPAKAVVPEDSESWTLDDLGNALVQAVIEAFRSEDGFTDVKEGDYFELPVFWAVTNEILDENQIGETMAVKPGDPCPRGEMVYFLYRTSLYDALLEDDGEEYEPVEIGTIPKTVVMDRDGVKITVNGIESGDFGDAVLNLTVVNGSSKQLSVDTGGVYVNTFAVSSSVYIPVEEDNVTFYDNVIVSAGETKDFFVGLNSLRENGITAVREIELQMFVSEAIGIDDSWEYGEPIGGEPVIIRTSLYDAGVSYDLGGTAVYDKDGLKVFIWKAENNKYAGPQIYVYAFNGGSELVSLDLATLKLDGEEYEAFFGMDVTAGKRCVQQIYLDLDYENVPVFSEGEITLRILDQDTWEPKLTLDPVKFPFAG